MRQICDAYFYEDNILSDKKSIFLAGPTLRDNVFESSWRKEALEILNKIGFDGAVYIPESRTGDKEAIGLTDDGVPTWEWERLESCGVILFWIPRDLKTLPGFTTNVEFGRYITMCPEKVVLGYPINAPKNGYLNLLYKRLTGSTATNTLEETLRTAVQKLS